jgi:hypothetical protein
MPDIKVSTKGLILDTQLIFAFHWDKMSRFVESLAILDYLEAKYPTPAML